MILPAKRLNCRKECGGCACGGRVSALDSVCAGAVRAAQRAAPHLHSEAHAKSPETNGGEKAVREEELLRLVPHVGELQHLTLHEAAKRRR